MFRRLLWHVNRTPVRHALKAALRAGSRTELRRRRTEAASLEVSDAIDHARTALSRDGFVSVDGIVPYEQRVTLAAAVASASSKSAPGSSVFGVHKDIWTNLVESQMNGGQLPADHPFTQFALDPALIALLASHFGEVPRLDYVTVTHSLPVEGDLRFSQLWHLDYDDVRVIKLFVYLTDVESRDGPFTFIPAAPSRQVPFRLKSHRGDEAMGSTLQHAVSMTGPRLSCFLVETSRCYHMGSRVAAGHARLMYTATYISSPRIYPERQRNFFSLTGNEAAIERSLLLPG